MRCERWIASVAAGLLLFSVAPGVLAQVDVSGVNVGTADETALFQAHPNAICVVKSMPAVEKTCLTRATYAGLPARLMYVVMHGKVIAASVGVQRVDFDAVVSALTHAYSAPVMISQGPPATGQVARYWSILGVSILAIDTAGPKRESESVVFFESEAARQYFRRTFPPLEGGPDAAAIKDYAGRLLAQVERARQAILNDLGRSAYDLEMTLNVEVHEAAKLLKSGASLRDVKGKLRALESKVDRLREFPHWELHALLGEIARIEGNPEDQLYHAAFQQALMQALERTGDGRSPDTAMKVISVREQYIWLAIRGSHLKPKSRVVREINGKWFDVWTIEGSAGEEPLYFDITGLRESARRVRPSGR